MLKDEISQNQEKMKEKTPGERFRYFCYYYWKPVLIGIVIVFCAAAMIRHFISESKTPSIFVAMVNCRIISDEQTTLLSDFAASRGFDTDANPVRADVNLQMVENNVSDSLSVANSQKISAYMENGRLDVLLAPAWVMEDCANQAYLGSLKEILPADLYAELEDRLLYHTYEDDGKVAVAVYVGDLPRAAALFEKENAPYLAIGNRSSRRETAADFLRYLLEDG